LYAQYGKHFKRSGSTAFTCLATATRRWLTLSELANLSADVVAKVEESKESRAATSVDIYGGLDGG